MSVFRPGADQRRERILCITACVRAPRIALDRVERLLTKVGENKAANLASGSPPRASDEPRESISSTEDCAVKPVKAEMRSEPKYSPRCERARPYQDLLVLLLLPKK